MVSSNRRAVKAAARQGRARIQDSARTSRELLVWWQYYNDLYTRCALEEPVMRITSATSRLGEWNRDLRILSISQVHIEQDPWLEVMDTLRHEMAHQYVDEVLRVTDEPPHGPAFRRACELLRVGLRPEDENHRKHDDRIVQVVSKLLALAGSPNEHEARLALTKARELLLRHNIAAAEVGASGDRRFGLRRLGPVRGRHHHYETVIGTLLRDYFFVRVIWVHTYDPHRDKAGSVLEVHGTETNLEMAEYVYQYLTNTLGLLWGEYQKTARRGKRTRGPHERLRYFAGIVEGFRDTLRQQANTMEQQHALVFKGDQQLDHHVRYHHPRLESRRTGGTRTTRAFEDGKREGRNLRLRKPITASRNGTSGPLLTTGGRSPS
ncbi:MAG: DUF2786 domain-containing protein [Planctomycetota bacterium]